QFDDTGQVPLLGAAGPDRPHRRTGFPRVRHMLSDETLGMLPVVGGGHEGEALDLRVLTQVGQGCHIPVGGQVEQHIVITQREWLHHVSIRVRELAYPAPRTRNAHTALATAEFTEVISGVPKVWL